MTTPDRYGAIEVEGDGAGGPEDSPGYVLQQEKDGLMRDDGQLLFTDDPDDDDDEEGSTSSSSSSASGTGTMSLQELLYSSSSYYAIAKPVTLTMVLAALASSFVNNDETRAQGEAAMANAYQMWDLEDKASSAGSALAFSLANALVMVSVICCMTFVIVALYKLKFMKCLIGYMIMCSGTLLGILGGNLLQTAIQIYRLPVDRISFGIFMFNFAMTGVLAVFWGQGIPKGITQGYLIATSVILAWHLSYFDDWTTWTLLFMLAIYDLCAVLTPCGPLKALVNLMSQDDAPEMPGLLFEADLPPEAKRPKPQTTRHNQNESTVESGVGATASAAAEAAEATVAAPPSEIQLPLALARVYQLPVISVPRESLKVLYPNRFDDSNISASPLLTEDGASEVNLPDSPNAQQLRAMVTVRLPATGGRIEPLRRRGRKIYLERDRHGSPRRVLWVDRRGKVFAEMKDDDAEGGPERNSIRLGLGDFIFYSVLVAKAAQYSFSTFAACTLVILSGLGGTLVLLSVYGHALPALPISIFLGVIFYLTTRLLVEPWIEAILMRPYYV